MSTLLDRFTDPDEIMASEYRTVYDFIAELAADEDDLFVVLAAVEELIAWAKASRGIVYSAAIADINENA